MKKKKKQVPQQRWGGEGGRDFKNIESHESNR